MKAAYSSTALAFEEANYLVQSVGLNQLLDDGHQLECLGLEEANLVQNVGLDQLLDDGHQLDCLGLEEANIL
jgi:hypothetical protein